MTKEKLAELARLAEAATPGPWEVDNTGDVVSTKDSFDVLYPLRYPAEAAMADANYCAAANPEAVLGLIARIEKLEKQQADRAINTLLDAPRTLIHDLWCEQPEMMQRFLNLLTEEIQAREALKEET